MFKEYITAGHQTANPANQAKTGVNLMNVVTYIRTPGQNYVQLIGTGLNTQVHMTDAEFEEFKINLKTAMRLKSAYE